MYTKSISLSDIRNSQPNQRNTQKTHKTQKPNNHFNKTRIKTKIIKKNPKGSAGTVAAIKIK